MADANDGVTMLGGVLYNDITLQHVKDYLKVYLDDDDMLLTQMIIAAQEFIYNYTEFPVYFKSPPFSFTIALLTIVGHWYEVRQITSEATAMQRELPWIFTGILNFHRGQNIENSKIFPDFDRWGKW